MRRPGSWAWTTSASSSQLTTAACVVAADAGYDAPGAPHRVSKLYYMAWERDTWEAYQKAFRNLTSTVEGVARQAHPWPAWAITTRIDCRRWWPRVWRAVRCHRTQMSIYGVLEALSDEDHEVLWGRQTFYRAYSTVNGGRDVETDLLEGLREPSTSRETA